MFAKLKKKLETENQVDLSQVDLSNVGPANLQRSESKQLLFCKAKDGDKIIDCSDSSPVRSESTSQYTPDNLIKTRSQDDLPGLQGRVDRVHRLETRIKEYAAELTFNIEKCKDLEVQLRKKDEEVRSQCSSIEQDWQSKYSELEAKNKMLVEKFEIAEVIKNKCVEKQDEIDELEGLQTQEMAKIKHMLLNCQQELQQSNTSLSLVETKLKSTTDELNTLKSEQENLKTELTKVDSERLKLKADESQTKSTIEEISSIKSILENEIDSLKTELLLLSSRAKQAEEKVNSYQDENAALRHTHEMYCKQSILVIEEKDAELQHLQERVTLLEQRAANCTLDDGDMRLQAVIAERNTFEQKVEESRQQLNEIKSSWSDKIMHLERQISHLNEKIVEDSEEQNRMQKENVEIRIALQEKLKVEEDKVNALTFELAEATRNFETQSDELTTRSAAHDSEVERLKQSHSALIDELNERLKRLESDKDVVVNEKSMLEESLSSKIHDLEAVVGSKTKNENALQSTKRELQNKLDALEANLARENETVQQLTNSLQLAEDTISELKTKNNVLEKSEAAKISQIESLQHSYTQKEEELAKTVHECKEQQSKYQQASDQLTELEKTSFIEISDLRQSIATLEAALTTLKEETSELMQQKEQFEEMKNSNEDLSSRIASLNESVLKQESEISDKNKTIRLQQQRILDMKKTFQKELKIQALPFEGSNGETTFEPDVAASHSAQKENHQSMDFIQRLQTFEGGRDLTEDINFRYLKHVVLKFMTSREYEAQHLIRAISVLLHLTPDEERLIKDTLQWKMSWFRSKPEYGTGQLSKTIPIT